MAEEHSPLLPDVRVISRFTRRWDLLIMLSVLGLLHNIVWNTWGPLAQTTSKLYGWDQSTIAIFANTSSIMFVIMFIPSAFIIRKSLKTALLVASGAMALGTTLRAAFLTDPEGNPGQFTIFCHICAVLNGISTPLRLWYNASLNPTRGTQHSFNHFTDFLQSWAWTALPDGQANGAAFG